MKTIPLEQLIFGITRMTERAISLIEAGMVEDALDVIDNRERALKILLEFQEIDNALAPMITHLDKLNEQLLEALQTVKIKTQSDVATAHKNTEVNKAYQTNQTKSDR
jgi:molecular chaperone GrpE (heat shock protein)